MDKRGPAGGHTDPSQAMFPRPQTSIHKKREPANPWPMESEERAGDK
ncbi:hypothetical protein J2S96_000132 [Arthrobacter bambusae]|nr:hypothetical protein [Arthrobacter bambusae]